jgi:UDP-4-amino-4,6-dideoxy-N-acetyl-beta-L-altrosamine transaminase
MSSIPYGRQSISEEDINAVVDTLRSDFLTQGPRVIEFEKAFAEYVGAKYAVAVSNGTAALHLCTLALGVEKGQKVITTPITFAASANCVLYVGGEVVFSDIDKDSALIDLDYVEKMLSESPEGTYSGIIPVDFAGLSVDMERVKKLAEKYNLWVIEDACHAPGGFFTDSVGNKQFCGNGNFSDLSIFSFHPVKHIAAGEGGMVTTNDEELYKKLLRLRTHGITKDPELLRENHGAWYYEMQELGYNYRLSDINAALALSQLNRADEGLKRRREIANIYDEAFSDNTSINPIPSAEDNGHAYHLYIIRVSKRKGLYDHLRSLNIFAQVHYIPVHTLPYYKDLGWKKGDMPVAESYYEECLSLPMFPSLTEEEQRFVIKSVKEFYA